MTSVEPNIPDNGKYNTTQACQLLGLSYKTLMKRVEEGVLSVDIHKNGRKYFKGISIKRFWRTW